ncbi:MAG: energy transducer TonB [Bryobacteraceae bacterium]
MAHALLRLADPVETGVATGGQPRLPPSEVELDLLPQRRGRSHRWAVIFTGSFVFHLVLLLLAIRLPALVLPSVEEHQQVAYHVITLYTPPSLMTQKAPTRHKVTKHIELADLLSSAKSQARHASPAHIARRFELPKQAPLQQPAPKRVKNLPTAPQVAVNTRPAPSPGIPNSPLTMPPKPKAPPNPFQDVGTEAQLKGPPTLVPPSSAIQSEINNLAQHRSDGHLVISDDNQSRAMPGSPQSHSLKGGPHSAVELQSDPRGADFRPYLARILAIVRANWRRVIPESARMGQLHGRTVIEFIIDRNGSIPKLVTADSSGSEPLDRAAVAGLSMSNPLPPLPADFKGFQVRLAFTFSYNEPSQ